MQNYPSNLSTGITVDPSGGPPYIFERGSYEGHT